MALAFRRTASSWMTRVFHFTGPGKSVEAECRFRWNPLSRRVGGQSSRKLGNRRTMVSPDGSILYPSGIPLSQSSNTLTYPRLAAAGDGHILLTYPAADTSYSPTLKRSKGRLLDTGQVPPTLPPTSTTTTTEPSTTTTTIPGDDTEDDDTTATTPMTTPTTIRKTMTAPLTTPAMTRRPMTAMTTPRPTTLPMTREMMSSPTTPATIPHQTIRKPTTMSSQTTIRRLCPMMTTIHTAADGAGEMKASGRLAFG